MLRTGSCSAGALAPALPRLASLAGAPLPGQGTLLSCCRQAAAFHLAPARLCNTAFVARPGVPGSTACAAGLGQTCLARWHGGSCSQRQSQTPALWLGMPPKWVCGWATKNTASCRCLTACLCMWLRITRI